MAIQIGMMAKASRGPRMSSVPRLQSSPSGTTHVPFVSVSGCHTSGSGSFYVGSKRHQATRVPGGTLLADFVAQKASTLPPRR